MGILRKFQPLLPRLYQNTLSEAFITSQVDYADMI